MNSNTEWGTLTPDVFPKIAVPENIAYTDKLTGTVAYRSNAIYIIAIDKNHMPETCDNVWEPVGSLDDGQYIVRVFYAEHTIWTDETGRIENEEKAFYSTDGMVIPIDDKDMKYCMYKKVKMTDLPE